MNAGETLIHLKIIFFKIKISKYILKMKITLNLTGIRQKLHLTRKSHMGSVERLFFCN